MTKSISHSAPTPSIREALKHALASLVAAISLLERTPRAKKAAPSDKMFDQMIADYKAAIEQGRAALSTTPPQDVMEGIALDGGMTLRDYFAAQIAAGMAAHSGTSGISYGPHDIAGRAYQVADAMLQHRENPDGR